VIRAVGSEETDVTEMQAPGPEEIVLTLPPQPRMVRVARLTASAVATFADLSVDDIDDLKIAVDEACVVLLERGDGGPVEIAFRFRPGSVSVRGRTAGRDTDLDAEEVRLATRILDVVADEFAIEAGDGELTFHLQKSAAVDGG
jgi:serine/threonine-protein kinase RsbW